MLILTRRPGEAILIGDDIKIHLISMHFNQARIGIEAPDNVKILREEILDRYPTYITKGAKDD